MGGSSRPTGFAPGRSGPPAPSFRRFAAVGGWPWLPTAWSVLILLWVDAYLRAGLAAAVELEPAHGNGPFQLFNPLRRIMTGQRGGVDFPFFHGLGVPYLHYPLFRAFGGDLAASELSRHLVTLILCVAGWVAVFAAATRRLGPTLVLTAAALVLSDQVGLYALHVPAHSIVGARAAAPMFVAAVLLAGVRPLGEAVLAGGLAGFGFVAGTEHGLATAVMLGVVWVGRRATGLPGGSFGWLALAGGSFVAAAGGALLLIGGPGGAAFAVRYALRDLPADQFWYFGVPPNPYLLTATDALTDRWVMARSVGPALVSAAGLVVWMRRDAGARPFGVVLIGVLVYGLLSAVGYLASSFEHYLHPLARTVILVWLVAGWKAADAGRDASQAFGKVARTVVVGLTVVGLLVGPTPNAPSSVLTAGTAVRETVAPLRELLAGRSRLGPKTAAHLAALTAPIDADRAASGRADPPVIWSCYAGLLEAHYGVFHPYFDYVIHAVGPAGRAAYLDAFRRADPEYVTTFHRGGSGHQEWLEVSTWPFFEEVLLNYEPAGRSAVFTLWRRRPGPWRTAPADTGPRLPAPSGPDHFDTPPPGGGDDPMVVEVEYEIHNPLAGVPILGQSPRYLIFPFDCRNKTPISLPPYATRHAFPVYPTAGKTPHFFATCQAPLGVGRVSLRAVRIRPLAVDGRDKALAASAAP